MPFDGDHARGVRARARRPAASSTVRVPYDHGAARRADARALAGRRLGRDGRAADRAGPDGRLSRADAGRARGGRARRARRRRSTRTTASGSRRAAPWSRPRCGEGRVVYGVTTGFGQLSSVRIDAADAAQLQVNLLRSHAVGSGEPLDAEVVRGMLLLLASSLRRGHSGVRAGGRRAAARAARARRRPGDPEPRLGRLVGRPRAARPPRARADRRGRGARSAASGCRAARRSPGRGWSRSRSRPRRGSR